MILSLIFTIAFNQTKVPLYKAYKLPPNFNNRFINFNQIS